MHTARTAIALRFRSSTRRFLLIAFLGWLSGASAAPPLQPPPRQSEFNENNYRPREIINRLPPPAPQRDVSTERRGPQTRKAVTRSARWSWKSRQIVERGTFQWRERNGRIDYASVCMNERPGSLRYRDCRRGAKPAFARLCREHADPAACHAQNNYSPLR